MRKGKLIKQSVDVSTANSARNPAVSFGTNSDAIVVKKTAESPKAASGKATAVPRAAGRLSAAVLIEAEYAKVLPKPDRQLPKASRGITLME